MRVILGMAALGASVLAAIQPAAGQVSFKGKTISVLVGFAPGGGIDTMARMFTRHMDKHIEGNPKLVIQNMPGAAGLIAMNRLANISTKDGTTIAYDTWAPLNQVIQSKMMKFDYAKLTMLGAFRPGPLVMFSRKDIVPGGMQTAADIVKAKNLIYAGQQPTLVLDIHGRFALNLLGLKFKYISGYKGPPPLRIAIEQNEANITTHGLQGYRAGVEPRFVKKGLFVPLWYFQGRDARGEWLDDDRVKDMPSLLATYRKIHGKMPEGFMMDAMKLLADLYANGAEYMWGPPGMNPQATAALRKAFYATAVDPGFIADQDKILGFRYQSIAIAQAAKTVDSLAGVDPKLADYFRKLMQ